MSITEEDLKEFIELNNQKKAIEQEMSRLKKHFHQFLDGVVGKEQKGEFQVGNYKVQRQIRSSTSYHDEHTVQILEELNLGELIVKRPDAEKIEAAIKVGLIEENTFADCVVIKQTKAIVVKETNSK